MEDCRIPDCGFSASSVYDHPDILHSASYARLNHDAVFYADGKRVAVGAWRARTDDANQFVQVNLGGLKLVSGVVLQGRGYLGQWVTKFKTKYKVNADGVLMVVKDANQQEDKVSCFKLMLCLIIHVRNFEYVILRV